MNTIETRFDQYFNEQEGYCLRSERFYDDVNNIVSMAASTRMSIMKGWLEAAFTEGANSATKDELTLNDNKLVKGKVRYSINNTGITYITDLSYTKNDFEMLFRNFEFIEII